MYSILFKMLRISFSTIKQTPVKNLLRQRTLMLFCEHYLCTHLSDRPLHTSITLYCHQNDFTGHSITNSGLCRASISEWRAYYFLHICKTAVIMLFSPRRNNVWIKVNAVLCCLKRCINSVCSLLSMFWHSSFLLR